MLVVQASVVHLTFRESDVPTVLLPFKKCGDNLLGERVGLGSF
jgi:hypothetical protein